jgi:Amidohydrolase
MAKLRCMLLLVALGLGALSRAADEPALFDGHIHYNGDAWDQYPVDKALQFLSEANITKALLSSTPIEGTLKLYAADPKRFIPELRVYRKATSLESWYAERATWWRDPETITFLENELKRGIYKGIGEFHLFGVEAQSSVIKRMVALAVERDILLHAHSDAAAIETLFAHDGKVKILWAHAGMNTPPATVGEWLERFPNLWVELSYRYDVVSGEALNSEWRDLFLRYPDRFVIGSDTWTPSRWPEVPALAKWARKWLAELPPQLARKIAYENGKRLFGF